MKDLTLVSQIKNGSDPTKIASMIEGMLYAKSGALLEQVRIDESAKILNEADPTPAVWKDEKGNPVVPSPADWTRHYQDLAASHVKAQVDAAKARWDEAAKAAEEATKKAEIDKSEDAVKIAKLKAAELKNLRMNITVGERTWKQKNTATKRFEKVRTKKTVAQHARIHKMVHGIVSSLLGGSGLAHHISHGVANAVNRVSGVANHPKS